MDSHFSYTEQRLLRMSAKNRAQGAFDLASLLHLRWSFVVFLSIIALIGVAIQYSAANGSWQPWAERHLIHFAMGLVVMLGIALINIRVWFRYAYALYVIAFVMLIAVEITGNIGMGARRWIDFGFFTIQPSEVMKIVLILALARYFHALTLDSVRNPLFLVVPVLMITVPAFLIFRQPDLGTATLMIIAGSLVLFAAGVRMWMFAVGIIAVIGSVPLFWEHLHDYQKNRILTFLNPERDPLGTGYHIIQSKVALGSGGLFGRGFMEGTQSKLHFLPEKQTDFIFTMLGEELGLMGSLLLFFLYVLLLAYGFAFAMMSQNHFGRLVAIGITTILFLYVFINVAMVTGLAPVVGIPLPLVSSGGTAALTLMAGFGFMLSADLHRGEVFGRQDVDD